MNNVITKIFLVSNCCILIKVIGPNYFITTLLKYLISIRKFESSL